MNVMAARSAIHRTQSAPIRPHQPVVRKNVATEPEINESLDSLARSMTEAALSSQGTLLELRLYSEFSSIINFIDFSLCRSS